MFTRDSIDRLRDAIDMVDLVGTKTDLRRVGSRWTGLCPFHEERTPSFSVNADEKLFYCFGCQAKGDAISFVVQAEGLDFPEAVELLSDRYGVQLEREEDDPRADEKRRARQRLYALLERAATFYAAYLWEAGEAEAARDYLAGRGLSEEILREFKIGYSPSAWDRMLTGAQRSGFRPQELRDTGLAQQNRDGQLYDRFRGRIMFPLADRRGKVLGFGARSMGEGRGPKYLNTSENEIYKKGQQLFGIDLARPAAAKSGRIVVVEGYTDVLALHQAGIRESVAIMGTALTQEQTAELCRAANVVTLALDADRSGQEAMLKATRSARDKDVELRMVEMPEGKDPADLLADGGGEDFRQRLDGALAMVQFQVRRVLADANLKTPAGRDRALEEARDLIAVAPPGTAMRDELVREVADRIDLPFGVVEEASRSARPPAGAPVPRPARAPVAPAGSSLGEVALRAEREFLVLCMAGGEAGPRYLSQPDDEHFSFEITRRARGYLLEHNADPLAALPEDAPELAALVAGVVHDAGERPPSHDAVLRMSILQLEERRILREIRTARRDDHTRQSELAAAFQRVRGELDTVMGQTA